MEPVYQSSLSLASHISPVNPVSMWLRWDSLPTYPGRGIHELWLASQSTHLQGTMIRSKINI